MVKPKKGTAMETIGSIIATIRSSAAAATISTSIPRPKTGQPQLVMSKGLGFRGLGDLGAFGV